MILTDKEKTIVLGVSYGLTNKEIADHLHIGESTVKTRLARIFEKAGGVHTRAELVRAGFEAGILTNAPPPEWTTR